MERSAGRAVSRGVLAGVVAGIVVALWFLAVDVTAGEPLQTPARLAAVLLERPFTAATFPLVGAYTVIHFGVFAALGAFAGWFLHVTGTNPGLLVGLVLGLGVMNSLHYSALVVAGVEDLTVLPGHHVVLANMVAGLAFMGVLHRFEAGDRAFGLEILGAPFLRRGVVTGLVGAGAVALWFLLLDILTGQPFFTPAALGSALLGSAGGAAGVEVSAGLVAFYSVVHLVAFSVAGALFVVAAEQVERTPWLWLLMALAFIVLEAVFVPVMGLLGQWVMGALAWWAVVVGNLLAVSSMGWWVWRTHPGVRRQLRDSVEVRRA